MSVPSPQRRLLKQASSVGYLCRSLPHYVQKPPIEAVVFGWGVNEDGQLVRMICPAWVMRQGPDGTKFGQMELCKHGAEVWSSPTCRLLLWRHLRKCSALQGLDTGDNVLAPKVVEALLGTRFMGRDFVKSPLVWASILYCIQQGAV